MAPLEVSRAASPSGIGMAAGVSRGDGVLNVNKARGWTSHDVVARLRRALRGVKVGHAGTLDPAATGVLPLLVGKATRIAEYLIDWDKEYRAVMRLGDSTDTQDATGVILRTRSTHHLTEEAIREAVAQFQGRLTQMPPMYSAVKVGGVPLYKAARAGRTVEREPREVTIHRIEVLSIDGRDVSLCIECSKGTYVRTLCADIGEALGVGGHLLALERQRVGPLTLERALSIADIEARLLVDRLGEVLVSLDDALGAIPAMVLDRPTSDRVLHGVPVPAAAVALGGHDGAGSLTGGQAVRLKDPTGRLIALGQVPAGGPGVGVTKDGVHGAVRILKVLANA